MIEDIRYAVRQWRKQPGIAAVALATLGLGIGAAAAMFALIQTVLLTPPPYAHPDRLVLVSPARLDGQAYDGGVTMGQSLALRNARAFEPPAIYRWTFSFLVRDDGSESLGGMVVTNRYFETLGLKPMLGRTFEPREMASQKTPPTAVVIGYDLWQRAFNGDPQVIGRTLRINRAPAPLTIVGVMPPQVRFLPDPGASAEPNFDLNARVDFWIGEMPDEAAITRGRWNLVARLRDGATIEQAQTDATALAVTAAQADPNLQAITLRVAPMGDVLNQEARLLLVPLFASVVLLFGIACVNVAGLMLARGLQRRTEFALRAALGAGRVRLFRQSLTESLVLALVGSALGALVAGGGLALVKAIGGRAVPRADAVGIGWPVLAFGLLAAFVAAGLAGLLPAAQAALPERVRGLKSTRHSAGRTERRVLGGVATLQIVLTVALLAGAGLLIRTTRNLSNVQPGYQTEQILAMTVTSVQRNRWKPFHSEALERVAGLPGVRHAAFVWGLPLTGNNWPAEIERPGFEGSTKLSERLHVPMRSVTPDYFALMGIPLLEGRGFRATDEESAPPVAVINAVLARQLFGTGNVVGRELRLAGESKPVTIIGVIADARTSALNAAPEPEVYRSFWQIGPFSKHLVIRVTGEPTAFAARVRETLRAVEPTAAVERVTTMTEIRRESTATFTFAMQLLSVFAVVATVLAIVGLYGVLSLSVGVRLKEMAVRKAIGAQPHQVVGLVLGEGSRLIGAGILLGAGAAFMLGRLLQTLLFDVRPADPIAIVLAALLFTIVALADCLVPALRAGRVDLMNALRQE